MGKVQRKWAQKTGEALYIVTFTYTHNIIFNYKYTRARTYI